jgi:hypothetical protein
MHHHRGEVVAIVIRHRLVAVEQAQHQRLLSGEDTGKMQLIEHSLDAVGMLADVLEKQDAAIDLWKMRRPDEVRNDGEVASPQRALAIDVRAVERTLHLMTILIQQRPAMIECKVRGHLTAEIVGRHRAGEGDHIGVRQCGQLERSEITVAQPTFFRARDRAEVELFDEARPTITAACSHRELDVRVTGHPHHGGEPLVVGGPQTAASACCRSSRRSHDDPAPITAPPLARSPLAPDEARGRIEADAVAARDHCKLEAQWLIGARQKKPTAIGRTRRRTHPPSTVVW